MSSNPSQALFYHNVAGNGRITHSETIKEKPPGHQSRSEATLLIPKLADDRWDKMNAENPKQQSTDSVSLPQKLNEVVSSENEDTAKPRTLAKLISDKSSELLSRLDHGYTLDSSRITDQFPFGLLTSYLETKN